MLDFKREIRNVNVTRYVKPLREGGSLPAIAEADDDFLYVLKFRGAGQGAKALIAELIGSLITLALGLKTPEVVFAHLNKAFGQTEPDEEIQDLLKASTGLNLAIHYLQGSITYDPAVIQIDPYLASQIVWLDSFLINVDRTVRNTNMLLWYKELWLIDFGASLYFHHSWKDWQEKADQSFSLIKDHVLLQQASMLKEADSEMKMKLNNELIKEITNLIPDEWLDTEAPFKNKVEQREAYFEFLKRRLAHSSIFVNAAQNARNASI
jgi:hypothetical protein